MSDKSGQRVHIKKCVALGKTATATYDLIKSIFAENAMGRSQVFAWFKRFKEGRTSMLDDPRRRSKDTATSESSSSYLTGSLAKKVMALVQDNERLTSKEIAEELDVSMNSCFTMIKDDLRMRRVAGKFVPFDLSDEQKQERLTVAEDFLDEWKIDTDFMNGIVVGGKMWIHNRREKRKNLHYKTLLVLFFNSKGIVHYEFIAEDMLGDREFNLQMMGRLGEALQGEDNEKSSKSWILYYDNAPFNNAISVQRFLTSRNVSLIRQPEHSPDLSPCDFWLFPRLQTYLREREFTVNVATMKHCVSVLLKNIPRRSFRKCFYFWHVECQKCVIAEGHYCEVATIHEDEIKEPEPQIDGFLASEQSFLHSMSSMDSLGGANGDDIGFMKHVKMEPMDYFYDVDEDSSLQNGEKIFSVFLSDRLINKQDFTIDEVNLKVES